METAKSWKTTVLGIIGAVMLVVIPIISDAAFDITKQWKTLLAAALVAAWGFVSKDYNVSGNPPINTDEPTAPKTVTTPPTT